MRSTLRHAPLALLAAFALALPFAAAAADAPDYTYIQGGYLNVDFDDFNLDGDGFAVGGSYALHKNVHLLADYQSVELDGDADFSAFSIGGGINYPLRTGFDLVGRLRFIDAEIDGPGGDDTGFQLEAGARLMINPRLELNGALRHTDVTEALDGTTSVVLGGSFEVIDNLTLGGDLELSDDLTTFFLRARWHFDPRWQVR